MGTTKVLTVDERVNKASWDLESAREEIVNDCVLDVIRTMAEQVRDELVAAGRDVAWYSPQPRDLLIELEDMEEVIADGIEHRIAAEGIEDQFRDAVRDAVILDIVHEENERC